MFDILQCLFCDNYTTSLADSKGCSTQIFKKNVGLQEQPEQNKSCNKNNHVGKFGIRWVMYPYIFFGSRTDEYTDCSKFQGCQDFPGKKTADHCNNENDRKQSVCIVIQIAQYFLKFFLSHTGIVENTEGNYCLICSAQYV